MTQRKKKPTKRKSPLKKERDELGEKLAEALHSLELRKREIDEMRSGLIAKDQEIEGLKTLNEVVSARCNNYANRYFETLQIIVNREANAEVGIGVEK